MLGPVGVGAMVRKCLGFGMITILACSGREDTPLPVVQVVNSAHYTVSLEDGLPIQVAQPILDRLEGEHARITESLGVTPDTRVTVRVWREEGPFLARMERDLGTRYPGAGGYVTGPTEARVLHQSRSPQVALHECAHAHSLRINPGFANTPRWLWEAVAIFEAGEFIAPRTLPYLVADQFPTLQDLNNFPGAEGRKTYEVGWLLAAFIREGWGLQAYRELIRTRGDLPGVLGLTESLFHQQWRNWVKATYLARPTPRHRPRGSGTAPAYPSH